ncbi:type I-B CRISPR-associated protein Cas7/Csh2 [Halalkalicoccus sp. NIPERK01]|uniref:type I-B CRISPR-associated protein Cas7/Csh2 n=1 Tax=Halalkalicoccus sp. NIPERK01 TaxID=3053469 RepID=UPI00256F1DC4|nr:type I-B CRISPR-associated protein Cas7/Csh2 [Halalkalicoccus sp. NIPERK01]MDL5360925.1 type I-B CRISPR-associated protein Cas7/Csh2 [Halalkalicoccus sp. NIPERK01]
MTEYAYADDSYDPVENRSEIVFCYDAVDANPNGNPLSGSNRPRIDPRTQQAVVTDVRLKRYLRDQLDDDGHGVYVRNVKNEAGNQSERWELLRDRLRGLDPDEWDLGDLDEDDEAALREEIFGEFLDDAADVRYFGATMSMDLQEKYEGFEDYLPDHFTGPVQFSPAKTIHPVTENEEYNSLTSVIATGSDKKQGGFDLDDHRIQYGFIAFHGLVDEHGAADTKLSREDVKRLDTLCWRAIKNQTISRSKVGQEPRLYLRVEYADEGYHLGGLTRDLAVDEDRSDPIENVRNVRDLTVDLTDLLARLERHADRIDRVRVAASNVLAASVDDEVLTAGVDTGQHGIYDALRERLGDGTVDVVDVYDEAGRTKPAAADD